MRSCVTMDLKEPGNLLLVLGMTRLELGGSLWAEVHQQTGGRVPQVDPGAWSPDLQGPPSRRSVAGWSGAVTT